MKVRKIKTYTVRGRVHDDRVTHNFSADIIADDRSTAIKIASRMAAECGEHTAFQITSTTEGCVYAEE